MRKFFENKFAFAAIVSLFALAFAWNMSQGLEPRTSHLPAPSNDSNVAHGPMLPPDPWAGGTNVAHGPMLPPDPWAGGTNVAHGPMLPPDPWAGGVTVTV